MSPQSFATGSVYVWFYPGDESVNFEGWHLTADATGCQFLASLLANLALGSKAKSPAIPVLVATAELLAVPGNLKHAAQAVRTLRFAREADPRGFAITHEAGALTVAVGLARIDELRGHILAIARGEGDLSMGADVPSGAERHRLWFWWMPSAPHARIRRR